MKRHSRHYPPEGKKFNTYCRKRMRMYLVKNRWIEEAIALHKIEWGVRPSLWQAIARALELHKTPAQVSAIHMNATERLRARNRIARGKK